jgi:hypothetical protein
MVMSVGFNDLKCFGHFLCPTLGDRSHHHVTEVAITPWPGTCCSKVLLVIFQAVSVYQDLIESKRSDGVKRPVWQRLVCVLEKQKALSPGNSKLLMQAYEVVLIPGKPDEDLVRTWNNYIKFLVKVRADSFACFVFRG